MCENDRPYVIELAVVSWERRNEAGTVLHGFLAHERLGMKCLLVAIV